MIDDTAPWRDTPELETGPKQTPAWVTRRSIPPQPPMTDDMAGRYLQYMADKMAETKTTWCQTCGSHVSEDGQCGCWCLLAEALQRYLGMDFDGSAQMAVDLWKQEADREYVWSAQYANDHDVETYPSPEWAPAELREQDARNYPHDEPCPKCGRRQWGLGPGTVDRDNPTDAEQATCGACGYTDA